MLNKVKSYKKIIIPFAAVLLLIFAAYIYAVLSNVSKYDQASKRIIREYAAEQLDKDPNELTDEDFAQMTELRINYLAQITAKSTAPPQFADISDFEKFKKFTIISDLSMLEKFKNLQEIELFLVSYPKEIIPQWMKILGRIGIINLEHRTYINLKPLENLSNLRMVNISYSDIKNIAPLAKLSKLENLTLIRTDVSDLEPLKKLRNLRYLKLYNCENISDEQVEELQKALPELEIIR